MISSKNKLIKQIKAINAGKIKDKFIIEGEKWLISNPISLNIEYFVISKSAYNKYKFLLEKYHVYIASDILIKSLSNTITPQGIIAVCYKERNDLEDFVIKPDSFILMIDQVSDPGNMGSILRTALAFGIDFIIISKNCVNIYNNKVIRSTAGAIFSLNIVDEVDLPLACNYLQKKGVKLIATSSHATNYHYNIDLKQSICLIFGNESTGVSESVISLCDYQVKIPINNIESLNVSVACGILLHEAWRQRI